jgi:glutamyl endopeptidase
MVQPRSDPRPPGSGSPRSVMTLVGTLVGVALGLAAVGVSPAQGQLQPQSPAETVTSDGRTFPIGSAPGGTGAEGEAGALGTSAGMTPARVASKERIGPYTGPVGAVTPPVPAPAQAESVIGKDTRTKVANTMATPFRMVAIITYGGNHFCSGFLIGPDTLATAGHCVYDTANNRFYDVDQFRVYPGYDATGAVSAPYGSCGARLAVSNTGWTVAKSDEYDYGVLKLTCTVGNQTGWFGYWAQTATLNGTASKNAGYPADKPLAQWKSSDRIRVSEPRRLYYGNDTYGGNSGSPIYVKRAVNATGCSGWCVMAVHAYGTYGASGPNASWNHGSRVTQELADALSSWKAL